jgi:hypothetical protein
LIQGIITVYVEHLIHVGFDERLANLLVLHTGDEVTQTSGFRARSLGEYIGSGGTQDLHVVYYLGLLALGPF